MILRQSHFVPPVPYLLATELGFLEEIEVQSTRTTSSAEQLAGLLDGTIDVAITAMDNLFEWDRAGADVRLIAQVEATTPLGIYARDEMATMADLAGCRFAVDAPDNGFALLARHLLGSAGIDVDYVVIGGVRERFEALLAGEIDASLLGPPFDKLAEQAGMRCVSEVNELLPQLPGQGLVVRTELLGAEELAGYLGALARGAAAGESMDVQAGVALLERHGYQAAAATAWAARARTLTVDPIGRELLTQIRGGLGMLSGRKPLAELCETGPLLRAS